MALEQDTGQDRPSAAMRANLPPPDPPSAVPSIAADLPGGSYGDVAVAGTVPQPNDNQNLATQFGVPTLTPQQYQGLLASDRDIQERRIGSEGALIREQERRDANYESRMQQMFDAQMAEGRHLQPWNAQAEMASRKHDLWEEFGSPAFLITMMASAFTAMPMVSALNGGAAAMNAINQGDIDAYDKAFDAWKTNTDLVLKRMDMQQRAFSNLGTLRTENLNEWRQKMQHTLAMYDDQRKLNMLNYGFDEEVIKAQEAEARLQTQLASASKAIQENNIRNIMVYGNPEFPFDASGKLKPGAKLDPQKMAQIVQDAETAMSPGGAKTAEQLSLYTLTHTTGFYDQDPATQRQQIYEIVSGVSGARFGAKGPLANTEVRRQWDAWDAANPNATDEDKNAAHNKIYADFIKNTSRVKLSTKEREMQDRLDKYDADNPDVSTEDRSAAHDRIIADVSKAIAAPKIAEAYAKQLSNPQWLASPEGQEWIKKQPPEAQAEYAKFIKNYGKGRITNPADAGWTSEAINAAAETYNETGILPHYMGARTDGPIVMGAIQARANDLLKEKYPDKTDVERIGARTKQWQLYHTQQVAINRWESGTQNNTLVSINTVVQHLETLAQLSEAAGGGDIPRFRQIAQWWATENGREAPTDLDTATIIVGNEVVKAITRGNMGTGEERSNIESAFSGRKKGQTQLLGAIGTARQLLIGQLKAQKNAFLVSTGLPEEEFNRILGKETRAYFGEPTIRGLQPSEAVRERLEPQTDQDIKIEWK